MYEQYLKKYKPEPKWNLEFYKNDDQYSDGDVENRILELIAQNEPEEYVNAISQNFDWAVYYHLTSTRRNILNWYSFETDSDVLEIGCGFGALTGLLCDKCRSVTSVELSQRRAMGTLLRCRDKDNLEIIVGNLNDIEFSKKYDYITLIGVLEYQGRFTDSDNPYRDFLTKIKQLLKPDGKLLIAIENQYGLKYWCGAGEDHTGVPYDGMNQYLYTNQGIRTFSREGLKSLIEESGFTDTYFYYPLPDYKLPTVVYSEKYLPQNENLQNTTFYYAPNRMSLLANEKNLYKDIIENGVFEFFANSFLVECSNNAKIGETVFASLCHDRLEEYRLGTRIQNNGIVEKFALSEKGKPHVRQTVMNEAALKERGLRTLGSIMDGDYLKVNYTKAIPFEKVFVDACRAHDEEKVIEFIEKLYAEILQSSDIVEEEKNIFYSLMPDLVYGEEKYGPVLKYGYLDMTFRNAFVIDGELYWYDQEWMLENIPADFIIFRALGTVYFSYPDINESIPMQWVIEKCGLQEGWEACKKLETLFSASVRDGMQINEDAAFTKVDEKTYVENIKKLMK